MARTGQVDRVIETTNLLDCWPSLDAIKEVEFVRQSGSVNMFDTQSVMFQLNEINGYNGISWLMDCKHKNIHPARIYSHFITQLERAYGSMRDILTDDDKRRFKRNGLRHKRQKLEAELAELAVLEDDAEADDYDGDYDSEDN